MDKLDAMAILSAPAYALRDVKRIQAEIDRLEHTVLPGYLRMDSAPSGSASGDRMAAFAGDYEELAGALSDARRRYTKAAAAYRGVAKTLPKDIRQTADLYYLLGLSRRQIAERLGTSTTTTHRTIVRAQAILCNRLTETG